MTNANPTSSDQRGSTVTLAQARQMGYDDGVDMAAEALDAGQTAEAILNDPVEADEGLINALGVEATCALLGEDPADNQDGWSEAMRAKLHAYNEGARAGARLAVGLGATVIALYEDNAGGLTLVRERDDRAYTGLEAVSDAAFGADAEALATDDTSDWTVEEIDATAVATAVAHPETRRIAEWRAGVVTVHPGAGASGRRYLGLEATSAGPAFARQVLRRDEIAALNASAVAYRATGMSVADALTAAGADAQLETVKASDACEILRTPDDRLVNCWLEGSHSQELGEGGAGFDDNVEWLDDDDTDEG